MPDINHITMTYNNLCKTHVNPPVITVELRYPTDEVINVTLNTLEDIEMLMTSLSPNVLQQPTFVSEALLSRFPDITTDWDVSNNAPTLDRFKDHYIPTLIDRTYQLLWTIIDPESTMPLKPGTTYRAGSPVIPYPGRKDQPTLSSLSIIVTVELP